MTAAPERHAQSLTRPVYLLDGNVLYALIDEAHVHHAAARRWFAALEGDFATCPITQGTLLRLTLRLGGQSLEQALAVLRALTENARHRFWPDVLAYGQIRWHGVLGHRQVTDAYLAALARHNGGMLASFNKGLVALHPDVGIGLDVGAGLD
jgi:toxin-antitoxin system PIN domain toxin